MLCCQYGHVNCLALLSARGADMSKTDSEGITPVHEASQYGQLKCLQLLAKKGVDLSKKDAIGRNPLDYARAFKQPECIDLLLASGVTGAEIADLSPVPADVKV
jgi:ankyrin repeat protein